VLFDETVEIGSLYGCVGEQKEWEDYKGFGNGKGCEGVYGFT